jgi:hypothetical protein
MTESRAEKNGEGVGGLAVVELKQFCAGRGTGTGVPIQIDHAPSPTGVLSIEKPTVKTDLTVARYRISYRVFYRVPADEAVKPWLPKR